MLERVRVKETLDRFAENTTNLAKRNAKLNAASGRGANSIRHNLQVYATGNFTLEFFMADYMEYQDKGVKGVKSGRSLANYRYTNKMPPAKAFDKWSIRRGIAPRSESGRFLARKSVNFALARHIYNKGIRPKQFFTNAFNRYFPNLPDDIIEAYGLDVADFMKSTLNTKTK